MGVMRPRFLHLLLWITSNIEMEGKKMNQIGNRVYIYGLDKEYRVIAYCYICKHYLDIRGIKQHAYRMLNEHPSIERVFAIDNGYDVYQACVDSIKTKTMEDRILFKMLLDADGIQVL
jgi:hypothetical protein